MELNKKVDQLLQELKSRKFNKVIFMDWSYDPDDILKYFNFYFEHMRFWKKNVKILYMILTMKILLIIANMKLENY